MTTTSPPAGLTVAVWQPAGPPRDVPAALRALDAAAAEAAALDARLLVCPELTLTGYDVSAAVAGLAQPADGPAHRRVAELAQQHRIAIVYSFPELDEAAVYISASLVERDGRVLARYRKSHLYGAGEAVAYVPGAGDLAIAELDGLRVGLLVCYDVEFPEQVRRLALAGADLVAVPTALVRAYEPVSTLLVPARAYENQLAIAYANWCGTANDLAFCGLSCVTGPDGIDLVRAGAAPGLHVARVSAEGLAHARALNTHLADRRPELYAELVDPATVRSPR